MTMSPQDGLAKKKASLLKPLGEKSSIVSMWVRAEGSRRRRLLIESDIHTCSGLPSNNHSY